MLIKNPSTPSDILEDLYYNRNEQYGDLKSAIADNPNASKRIREDYTRFRKSVNKLMESISVEVKERAAEVLNDLISYDFSESEICSKNESIYNPEWCTGDITDEMADKWNRAMDLIADYVISDLFGGYM